MIGKLCATIIAGAATCACMQTSHVSRSLREPLPVEVMGVLTEPMNEGAFASLVIEIRNQSNSAVCVPDPSPSHPEQFDATVGYYWVGDQTTHRTVRWTAEQIEGSSWEAPFATRVPAGATHQISTDIPRQAAPFGSLEWRVSILVAACDGFAEGPNGRIRVPGGPLTNAWEFIGSGDGLNRRMKLDARRLR